MVDLTGGLGNDSKNLPDGGGKNGGGGGVGHPESSCGGGGRGGNEGDDGSGDKLVSLLSFGSGLFFNLLSLSLR